MPYTLSPCLNNAIFSSLHLVREPVLLSCLSKPFLCTVADVTLHFCAGSDQSYRSVIDLYQ